MARETDQSPPRDSHTGKARQISRRTRFRYINHDIRLEEAARDGMARPVQCKWQQDHKSDRANSGRRESQSPLGTNFGWREGANHHDVLRVASSWTVDVSRSSVGVLSQLLLVFLRALHDCAGLIFGNDTLKFDRPFLWEYEGEYDDRDETDTQADTVGRQRATGVTESFNVDGA